MASSDCIRIARTALFLNFLLALQIQPTLGADMGFANNLFGARGTTLTYDGWYAPQPASPSDFYQNRFGIQAPVLQRAQDSVSVSSRGGQLHLGENAASPASGSTDSGPPLDLWSVELGGQYQRRLEGEKFIGGRLGVGSASDHPMAGMDVTTISLGGYYGFANSKESTWVFFLFFSNNNPISNYLPIPGAMYLYRTKTFVGMFGLPFFSLQWMPVDPWSFSLAVLGPAVSSEIAYGQARVFQAFVGANWSQQMFLKHDRQNSRDRLYFDEKRAVLGSRFPLWAALSAEPQAGYAFNRTLYESSRFGLRNGGARDFKNSWFLSWNMKLQF